MNPNKAHHVSSLSSLLYNNESKFNSTALVGYEISKLPNTSGCRIPKLPITIGSFTLGLINTISAALPGKYVPLTSLVPCFNSRMV
mmetsp:Transcript_27536/g.57473  ORF Transcript_27536/g.57473 Transcript_27536/m.57473 type:complete len:86 (-) Transcript_27536:1791-2048(-)